jgi:hypothetical protein
VTSACTHNHSLFASCDLHFSGSCILFVASACFVRRCDPRLDSTRLVWPRISPEPGVISDSSESFSFLSWLLSSLVCEGIDCDLPLPCLVLKWWLFARASYQLPVSAHGYQLVVLLGWVVRGHVGWVEEGLSKGEGCGWLVHRLLVVDRSRFMIVLILIRWLVNRRCLGEGLSGVGGVAT